jgi:hypothetical protein
MSAKDCITDYMVTCALDKEGFKDCNADKGRLMLAELMLKAQAGYRNSHTEELFLNRMDVMKKDRTPNFLGRKFLCAMFYNHSSKRPEAYDSMTAYRK